MKITSGTLVLHDFHSLQVLCFPWLIIPLGQYNNVVSQTFEKQNVKAKFATIRISQYVPCILPNCALATTAVDTINTWKIPASNQSIVYSLNVFS